MPVHAMSTMSGSYGNTSGGQHGDREMCVMRPAWVDETLFPFESHFAQINGAQVHYIDEGQVRCSWDSTATRRGRFSTGTS